VTHRAPAERPATPSAKDGVGTRRRHRVLAAALLLACVGGIGYYALHEPARANTGTDAHGDSTQAADATVPSDATAMTRQPLSARRASGRPAADDLASVIIPGTPVPTMDEVIEGLHKAGIRTGLGAFNPPGTSPPLVGLAVPEDFVLPEGYVRHHQATDDGQEIEPILMYSPDYEFLDATGQPVAIPADRVVPASHAPAGLPIRQIRIPPPQPDPGSPS
jgi:hypothetical protein